MAVPKNINQTVQYQEGSVVSKEIVNKLAGTITLFAFDKNQGLSEHVTPYEALIIVTEGIARITVSGVKNNVKEGEMLLMPTNSPHSLKATERFKMLLIMIKTQ